MSDDFETLNSKVPDFESMIIQRAAKHPQATPQGTFDPYQAMLKKKEAETAPVDPSTIKQWPEDDVKTLQDYCERMGIVGFSAGRMHPLAALAMLKGQLGDNYTDVPLEERLPAGYQKLGTKGYGPNNTYSQKKQILHG